ncbi:glycoside hydrolase family 3 protein [Actinotalea sp. M2MS4P-6]|uniref:glycoside hydrolase family 3 protein n=1 Tax=Actinotalea sp. M2MS4P-6 TaxID=2983762 RepID=UPI0021E456ED|nr:glycoside hydrolase family 3 N-terminal domain-containing protein [Actinotalea sp. M2MS4P-6]MCV2395161.1 glycoside hydrolase family 3 protein [Actinotalea sp. M2MS4P-6]
MTVDVTAAPFSLDPTQADWVRRTREAMTLEEKVGQIFCVSAFTFSARTIKHLTGDLKVGGWMFRPMPGAKVQKNARKLQAASDVPLLLAANLESGGNGAASDGTSYAMPGGVAATADPEAGYRLGKISCREGAAVGINWAFAPIVDVDLNHRNPITNVRSFGSDPDLVTRMAQGYLLASREEGVAATIKHFPGDGVDERDQHLLVSVNTLSADRWWATSGAVYRRLIDDGAMSVMVGHIAQPAVARQVDPTISDDDALLPGSLSKTLVSGLLRDKLGFNGLVVTDSTLMVGFMQTMPRREALPLAIERGCDMILFNRNIDEDYGYVLDGVRTGLLSAERLDDAVTRVLALKAALRLPEKQAAGTLVPGADALASVGTAGAHEWAVQCADRAVTLVKDRGDILPLNPAKRRRVYLNVIENYAQNGSPFARDIKRRLELEGFEVTLRKRKLDFNPEQVLRGIPSPTVIRVIREITATTGAFVSKYDMTMIVLNMETVSNATVVRVDWKVMFGLGNDIPWYAGEMPLVVVSTANPYHLLDIPMAHVYVNAYTNNEVTLDAVFDKLMGRSPFTGVSPSDPFCGHEDCAVNRPASAVGLATPRAGAPARPGVRA